jgi:mannose-1-phosphate guanylyltransferase
MALEVLSREPVIVTLGITPTRPDTGYGYIQFWDDDTQPQARYHKVKTFTEKPSEEIARTFIDSGEFLWNSGMFIFSAQTILQAIERYSPDLHELFQELLPYLDTPEEPAHLADVYTRCRNISIDFAVMEKADNVFVIQSSFGWSDLGTWRSLYEHLHKDSNGNVLKGNIITYDTSGNLILSPTGRLIVVKGLQNKIVVEMDDVLMILDRDDEQSVREIVANIRLGGGMKYL